jgi:hypothetical protein
VYSRHLPLAEATPLAHARRAVMRRLPVINSPQAPEDALAASRPRWHWLGIGAGLTAFIWIPLALLVLPFALPVAERLSNAPIAGGRESAIAVALHVGLAAGSLLIMYALASFLAGMLVGRFGGGARARDAAWSAVLSAFILSLLASLGPGAPLLPAVLAFVGLALVGAPLAFAGGLRGERQRGSGGA